MHAIAVAALALGTTASADTMRAPPANALILFGARWCAPCTAELRDVPAILDRLGSLVDGRVPAPALVLAWIDRAPPLSTIMQANRASHGRSQIDIVPAAIAAPWAEQHMARARGLPFAVMTDPRGGVCALHQGALPSAAIAGMWAQCHSGKGVAPGARAGS